MDDFKKNSSTPTPIKASSHSVLKHSLKEGNENNQTMGSSRLQNPSPKKFIPSKHFMTPTVSASSKVKKKVLVERNEAASTHSSVDLSSYRYPSSPLSSSSTPLPEPNQCHDFESSPYNPLTNYLSPRPQFLLYNPNKHVEILRRQENVLKRVDEAMSSSLDYESSPSSSSSSFEQVVRGMSDSEDEDDERLVEDRHWFVKKVMKVLFVIGVLIVSTLYISSMNSTTAPMPYIKDRYYKSGDGFLQVSVNDIVVGNVFLNQTEENGRGLMERSESFVNESIENEDMDEQVLGGKQGEVSDKVFQTQIMEITQDYKYGILGDKIEDEAMSFWELLDQLSFENATTSGGMIREDGMVGEHYVVEDEIVSSFDQVEDDANMKKFKPKSWELNRLLIENVNTSDGIEKEEMVVEHEVEDVVEISDDMGVMVELWDREDVCGTGSSGAPPRNLELICQKIHGHKIILGDILGTCDIDENFVSRHSDHGMKDEAMIIVIMFSIVAIAVYSVVQELCCVMRRKPSLSVSLPAIHPSKESDTVKEDGGLSVKEKEGSIKEKAEQVVEDGFHVNPSSFMHPEGQRLVELYRSQAPTVELLGEFEVAGRFTKSSLKSCSHKPNPAESQESNLLESQERKKLPLKWGMSSPAASPSVSEFGSATQFNFNGSSTPNDKSARKEETRGGEEFTSTATTPLRRSSRIRSKTVMSPR